jgi:hypothetical protein
MSKVSGPLYMLFYSIRNAGENEFSKRRGIDGMLELAFSSRKAAIHDIVYVDLGILSLPPLMPSSFEKQMKLPNSNQPGVRVGPIAEPDALVVMKIDPVTMDAIHEAISTVFLDPQSAEIRSRLYWAPIALGPNSLIAFPGEFKNRPGQRNQNQLLIDLCTAQSQRRAFGLPNSIVWGAVGSGSLFTVYSASWGERQHVCRMRSRHVLSRYSFVILED